MKEDRVPTGLITLIFCLLVFILTWLARSAFPNPLPEEKEVSIREYLEHPEYYEIKKIYEDTTLIGYKIEYTK